MSLALRLSTQRNIYKVTLIAPRRASSTGSSVRTLMATFKDPASPFYLAPGTAGPASPDEMPSSTHRDIHTSSSTLTDDAETSQVSEKSTSSADAPSVTQHAPPLSSQPYAYDDERRKLRSLNPYEVKHVLQELGYDPGSFLEQRIVWGDMDSFQHVNNVRYLRFLESSRIRYMANLGRRLGGPKREQAMIKGKGVSLILKSIDLSFRRPVTYPDTLLVAHRPVCPPTLEGTSFPFHAIAYSYTQQALVLTSNSECVWYDYDRLRKAEPERPVWKAILEVSESWATKR
ncbi:hypothetical protein NEOLEDRAFT_1128125 [Neolentinus lepideus HHB14362 ss-1]|uniref:Thioesterase/thiol ester dehydrase-isomerase n=1 Tax=Neolentinus lepideus HHB14362 ss-1 TaxID=1314782 RepID=A0A165VA43_9AGAM|nr:hypothetical protein NEOLEDRAFT_1128125 [Neolentinus lepideus HHB14362 ss-1]